MPTPVSFAKLDVINQALTGLHEARLTDVAALGGTSKHAQVMREHYDAVVQFCFTRTNWRFATAKVALNKLSAAPLNRWAAAWQLPTDHLKTLTTWPPSNYELANRQLLTNETTRLEIDYIRLIEEGYWPSWFTRLVVAELVKRTCRPITGDAVDQDMKDELRAAESDAFFQDAGQQPNQTIQSNDFIDVRV
jgi:hypothetical protein